MTRVVAAAIVRDGRVLAARRGPGRSQAGLWELPGGKVEPGEDEPAALAREIAEELGVRVDVGERLAASTHGAIELVAWACTTDGDPVATEHSELRWLAADELDTVDWCPADVPLLSAVRRRLSAISPRNSG